MEARSSNPWRILAASLLLSVPNAVIAATVSGTVSFPVSDGGYTVRTVGTKVRVEGTSLVANVVEGDPQTTGTFTLTNVPAGPVTLILEEPAGTSGTLGDRFTPDSKRVAIMVTGDVSGVAFDTVHHWRNLPGYPPPYHDPAYDQWEPFFASARVGFMSFLNRGVAPFEHELWRTIDGGQSWAKIGHWYWGKSSMKPDFSGTSMLFVDADHGIMRGVGNGPSYIQYGVMRTADGGQSWTYVDLPNAPPVGSDPGGNGLVSITTFAAIDATHWIICGSENIGSYMGSGTPGWLTIWETDDAGASWRIARTLREDYGSCTALGADPSGVAVAFDTPYAFGGNRILFTRGTAGTWTLQEGNVSDPEGNDLVTNTGYGVADLPMLDGSAWVSGGRWLGYSTIESGLYRSTDGGTTWSHVSDALLQAFDVATELRINATAGGPAYLSYDGGETFRFQAQGGGICCHGNFMFAFGATDVFWKDGGVGDPNSKGDVLRYFEEASPNFEVVRGTAVGNATVLNGATNVPVVALSATSYGLTDLLLQPLRLHASGTGNDRSEIDRVTLWWDRDADGTVSTGDTALSTTTFGADDGIAELGLGGAPQLHQLFPKKLLVTYDLSKFVRNAVTFTATLEPASAEAFTDEQAAQRVAATAPNGTVIAGATITSAAAAPIAPSIPPQSATENQGFGFTAPAFTDPNGDALTYAFSGLPAWLAVCYPSQNPRYLCGRPPYSESSLSSDRAYSVTVTARDPSQNQASATFMLTVLNVNRPPVPPAPIPDQVVKEATSYGFTLPAFSDPDGDSLDYEFQGLPSWLSVTYPQQNARYVAGKPPLTETGPNQVKDYVVTLVASDPAGAQASKAFLVRVTNNAPPAAQPVPAQFVNEYESYGYTVPPFTDADDTQLTYQFSGLPSWLTLCYPAQNPRYLCGRPPYTESTYTTDKSYTVGFSARDPAGQSTTTSFELTVLNTNRPPLAPASIPGQTATEGQSFGYTAPPFADPDGETLTYSFSGLPGWLSVCYPAQNPRYLCGRPPIVAGPGPTVYAVAERATDPSGAYAERSFNVTVYDAAP